MHEASLQCKNEGRHLPSGETDCMFCSRNPDFDIINARMIFEKNNELNQIIDIKEIPYDMFMSLDLYSLLEKVKICESKKELEKRVKELERKRHARMGI